MNIGMHMNMKLSLVNNLSIYFSTDDTHCKPTRRSTSTSFKPVVSAPTDSSAARNSTTFIFFAAFVAATDEVGIDESVGIDRRVGSEEGVGADVDTTCSFELDHHP